MTPDSRMHNLTRRIYSWSKANTLLLLIAIISFAFMYDVGLNGDENYYLGQSRVLNEFLRGNIESPSMVYVGFHTPGMGYLLAPLSLIFNSDVPLFVLHLYGCLINLILLALISNIIRKEFGSKIVILFQTILLLNPYYVMYFSTIFSELIALHFVLLCLLWFYSKPALAKTFSGLLFIALLCAITLYLRGIYIPIFLFFGITVYIHHEFKDGFAIRKALQATVFTTLLGLLTIALFSPWTQSLSKQFGTSSSVTSTNISKIVWFENGEFLKEAKAKTKQINRFYAAHHYILDRAHAENTTYKQQGEIEFKKLRETVGQHHIKVRIKTNFNDFIAIKRSFHYPKRFISFKCRGKENCYALKLQAPLKAYQNFIWPLFLGLGVIGFLFPFISRDFAGYTAGFVAKGLAALICFHPFLIYAHPRYHVQLIPLIALLVCCMVVKLNNRDWMKPRSDILSPILILGYFVAIAYFVLYLFVWKTGSDIFIR